jgi:3-methylcrotonyl-CoA carboxylase alpha subunit
MGAAAVAAARTVAYQGAGTVEFLYDGREFYFLEMNTRLQVEHPVTEMITGVDLVEWQLRVASGEPLPLAQAAIRRNGHAVEARLYAEDPERGFLPSTGRLQRLRLAEGIQHIRVDSGVSEGDEVTVHYDPMLAKVIAWAPDRTGALGRLRAALERTEVEGVRTNARFLWEILGAEAVRSGDVSTRLLEHSLQPVGETPDERTDAWLIAAAVLSTPATGVDAGRSPESPWVADAGFRLNGEPTLRLPLQLGDERHWMHIERRLPGLSVRLAGRAHEVALLPDAPGELAGVIDGRAVRVRVEAAHDTTIVRRQCLRFEFAADTGARHHASAEHEGHLRAPMPGHVLDVRAVPGSEVAAGTVLVVLEAMKMEHSMAAPWAGTVKTVAVKPGDRVEEGADLVLLEPIAAEPLRQPVAQD